MRKIYMYSPGNGKVPIADFLNKSNKKIKKKFVFILELISTEKDRLGEPYVKHFSIEKYKQLYEIRIRAGGTMVRIIYCEKNRDIILLHAFYKHDKRDTEKALEYTLKILNDLNENELFSVNELAEVIFE